MIHTKGLIEDGVISQIASTFEYPQSICSATGSRLF